MEIEDLDQAQLMKGLVTGLRIPLIEILGNESKVSRLEYLCKPSDLADGTTKLLVLDNASLPTGVVLISSLSDRSQVARGMCLASEAKDVLGQDLGRVILEPIGQGVWESLSWVILPYRKPLSNSRLVHHIQRAVLRTGVLHWLRGVTKMTQCEVKSETIATYFEAPLLHLSNISELDESVRLSAIKALKRLTDGCWRPRHILMHGDLWEGNLLRMSEEEKIGLQWRDRFVVIDWPGALLRGYPFYDLIRIAQSMRLNNRKLGVEIGHHCDLLGCEREDAMSYLLASLGWLSMNLGYFPLERFAAMANSCYITLNESFYE